MKLLPLVAFFALGISAAGCKSPGDAFADDMCACTDKACVEKAMKEHETKFPESKSTLGEAEKLPEDKKAQYNRGVTCMFKVGLEAEKKK